jgi:hypothetical protein
MIPQLKPRHTGYRRGKAPDPSAFLERYRSHLAAMTAERHRRSMRSSESSRGRMRQSRRSACATNFRPVGSQNRGHMLPARAITPALRHQPSARRRATMDDIAHAASNGRSVSQGATPVSRRAWRKFFRAWWNADSLDGFDLTDIFAADRNIASDMATVASRLTESPVCAHSVESA